MPASKNIDGALYPDLIAAGGLGSALQSSLRDVGSSLTASELLGIHFVVHAGVESGSRFSQVYIDDEERLFCFDFWARGVMLATAGTPHLTDVARAIDMWVGSACATAELAAAFRFVTVAKHAAAYERGEEVEQRWQSYMASSELPELMAFVAAASQRKTLRQLFPYTSLNIFCFSRCTGYPFTRDTPFVRPVMNGQYEVVDPSGTVLGRGNGDDAAELVVAHLPHNCGPAIPGTADTLAGAESDATSDRRGT